MKLLIMLLAVLPIQWQTDFEAAKKTAAEQNKLILLNFSGSDWCAPCILMRKNYLESEDFGAFANDHLVLVNADFPRKSKNALPADLAKRNGELADRYNKQGHFPFTLLLDSTGKVLKTWNGKPDASVGGWISEIKSVCDARQ